MLLTIFLIFIGIATLFSIKNWRRGIFFMILIGEIKDPIRKITPNAPAYLALATVPIWAGILLGALIEDPGLWQDFRKSHKRLSTAILIFIISLFPAAVKSATYGTGSWQVALVGCFSYSSVIFGLLIGYIYPKYSKDLKKIMMFFCAITAFMLIGTPMEYLGIAKGWKALGTSAMKYEWLQTSVYGTTLRMFAGFYRSPDVMGWYAIMLSMLSIILALQSSGHKRYFWILMAGWGLMGAILCGRRKMIFMMPVFITMLCWLYWSLPKRIKFSTLIAVILISSGTGYLIYKKMGPDPAIEKYYLQDPKLVFGRVEEHGFYAIISTYRQSGIFGEGLGTATQGIEHLKVSKPHTWQEGGMGKILVELGVPGFLCFLFFIFTLVSTMWRFISHSFDSSSSEFVLRAGLIGLVAANAVSFVVSAQIFGDPSIICFFSVLIGFILSKTPVSDSALETIINPELKDDSVVSDMGSPLTTKPRYGYRQFYKTSNERK